MKWRKEKISIPSLVLASVITIIFMIFEFSSKSKVTTPFFREKIAATELTKKSFDIIKEMVQELNFPIDKINDPNETGLIGPQYSTITSGRGDLNEKLTTTNPNIAGLVIELLKRCGVKEYDTVAVALTGSYPGLNIATLCALKVLNLHPIIITSVSASMWGASHPQLTCLDMETRLRNAKIFPFKSVAATIGGEDDMGRGLSPEGREIIQKAIIRNGIQLLDIKDPTDRIEKRWNLYTSKGRPKAFINVGETKFSEPDIEPGYIPPGKLKYGKGIIVRFSKACVPVINLIALNNLAQKYGLPIAPIPLPRIGSGRLYYRIKYSVTQAVIYLFILLSLLLIILKCDLDYYLGLKKEEK